MNFSISAKAIISSNFPLISPLVMPRMVPLRKMFSRPVSSGWKPVPTSEQAGDAAFDTDLAGSGGGDAGKDFQQCAFPCTVTADNSQNFALLHFEGDVFQGPEGVGTTTGPRTTA